MPNITGTAKELLAELEKLWGKDEKFTLYVSRNSYAPYNRTTHKYGTKVWTLNTSISKNAKMTKEQLDAWTKTQAALKVAKKRAQYEALKAEFGDK